VTDADLQKLVADCLKECGFSSVAATAVFELENVVRGFYEFGSTVDDVMRVNSNTNRLEKETIFPEPMIRKGRPSAMMKILRASQPTAQKRGKGRVWNHGCVIFAYDVKRVLDLKSTAWKFKSPHNGRWQYSQWVKVTAEIAQAVDAFRKSAGTPRRPCSLSTAERWCQRADRVVRRDFPPPSKTTRSGR
jgi:hypothetical protein